MKSSGKLFRSFSPLLQRLYKIYASFRHRYRFREVRVTVEKGVFDPLLFNSTVNLIDYIESLELENVRFLELGCGSGMASVYFSKKGWQCTAVDISSKAVESAKANTENNNTEVRVLQGDLYTGLREEEFDIVFITP